MHLERMPGEDEGREQSDVSTSQGTPKISSKLPEVRREARNRFFYEPSEETNPADTFIFGV